MRLVLSVHTGAASVQAMRSGRRNGPLLVRGLGSQVPGGGRPVDCWVAADPAIFLLIGYGRVSRRSQIVRGRMIAGGRKPWLAVTAERLLTGP